MIDPPLGIIGSTGLAFKRRRDKASSGRYMGKFISSDPAAEKCPDLEKHVIFIVTAGWGTARRCFKEVRPVIAFRIIFVWHNTRWLTAAGAASPGRLGRER